MKKSLVLIALALLALDSTARSQGSVELEWIFPDSPGAVFGVSTALDGAHLLIGDSGQGDNGPWSGSAFVFDAGSITQLRELLASDAAPYDGFGGSVALRGGLALVGAPQDDDGGTDSGSAYVFDVFTGAQLHKLVASDASAEAYFGQAVAISGSLAVIGAPTLNGIGSAYLFDLNSGTELAKLQASDGEAQDGFGRTVAIDAARVLIGAPGDDDDGLEAGAAYLFDASGLELAKWRASNAVPNARFGYSVALGAGRALIGAPSANRAYLLDPSTGRELEQLAPGDASDVAWFGGAVALGGGLALVGASHTETHYPVWWSGVAHLFEAETGVWLERLAASNECGLAEAQFGHSVALAGRRALIGAIGCVGSAYLFETSLTGLQRYCEGSACPCGNDDASGGCANSSGSGARLEASGTSSLARDDLVLIAQALPQHEFGILYRGRQSTTQPFGDGLRCAGGFSVRLGPPRSSGATGSISNGPGLVAQSCATGILGCLELGASWHYQAWFRDPLGPCGNGFNTSDALRVVLSP